MTTPKTLPEAVHRLYRFHWSGDATARPTRSGIYLTRDAQGHEWFRYFDASLGDWYISWKEREMRGAQAPWRIAANDADAHVAAWARCQRVAGH